jgi:hypothetical protein
MEGSHNAEQNVAASIHAASSNATAAVNSPGQNELEAPMKGADNLSCPLDVAATASESASVMAEAASFLAEGSAAAPSAPANDLNGHVNVNVSPKPKIRIKLKLGSSPKKDAPVPSDVKIVEDDSNPTEKDPPEEDEEDWLCLKCINNNGHKRIRCWNCKGWKVRQMLLVLLTSYAHCVCIS